MKIYRLPCKSKYVIEGDCPINVDINECVIYPLFNISLMPGKLTLLNGFQYDGASGPAIDTASFMLPSAVHDALYILMRDELIDTRYRVYADDLLRDMCISSGMSKFRAWYVHKAVRMFGGASLNKKLEIAWI